MNYAEVLQLKSTLDALFVQFPELQSDEVLRADMFEAETDFFGILQRLLAELDSANAMVTGIKERAEALNARKARFERHIDGIRSLIEMLMNRADLKKVNLPEATLSISHRKPVPQIIDEAALPDECMKVIRKPDMKIINSWVDSGNLPPGVRVGNGTTSLTVRVR